MNESSTCATHATLVLVLPKKSLKTALELVEELTLTLKEGKTLSEQQSCWFAAQQERVFESADHESENGTCECDHHIIAYRLGDIANQYYRKDFVITHEYLISLQEMITNIL